jgi:ParB family chromosome partitioning protein
VRQQLNPVDEAYAFQVLMDDLGVTQETLAGQIGKSRSTVANKVRLLELPAPVQELLISGALSEGHGRALLGLPSRGEQMKLARKAAEKGLSVRAVEAEVRRLGEKEPDTASGASAPDVVPAELLDSLRDAFFGAVGVMPSVRLQSSGGRVELRFADLAELEQIVTRLSAAVPGRDEV